MNDKERLYILNNKKNLDPKVARPQTERRKRAADIHVDPKYAIDEKDFAPVVIDSVSYPESSNAKNRGLARYELEALVEEAIKKKQDASTISDNPNVMDNSSSQINVSINDRKTKTIPSDLSKIDSFDDSQEQSRESVEQHKSQHPDNSYSNKRPKVNSPEDDLLAAKLKAQAILLSAKPIQPVKEFSLGNFLMTTVQRIFFLRRRHLGHRASEIASKQSQLNSRRRDLEMFAEGIIRQKTELGAKEKRIKEEIELDKKSQKVKDINIDNSEDGITIESSVRKGTIKKDIKSKKVKVDPDFII